jgi:phosphoglycerol transferase MdoB-like AlkP superfamily enzyme
MIYISENLSTPDQFLITGYLHRLTGFLLPGQFWRLFWALSIAAAGMIFFDKWRWYFLAVAGMFSSLILIANMIYYDFFTSIITVSSLSIANHLPGVWSCIMSMFRTKYILMILVFLIFIVVGILMNKYHDASLNTNLPSFVVDKVVGIACALLAFYSFSIGFHLDTKEVLYKKINGQPKLFIFSKNDPASEKEKHDLIAPRYLTSPRGYALTFGMYNFYFKDMIDSFIGTPIAPLRNDAVVKIAKQLDRKYQINKISSPFAGIAARKNIFLIDLESLHPFLFDLTIGGIEVTPTLNKIGKTALHWKYILNHAGRGSSSDAEFSIMNGLLPMYWEKKITAVEIPRTTNLITLPHTLKEFNYHTLSFHGYHANFWSRSINHPLWGIDSMFFKNSFQTDDKIGMGVPDHVVFLDSLEILKKQKGPFFAYMISLSTHYPYSDVPEKYQHYFRNEFPADSEAIRYLQLFRYVDDALDRFFNKVKDLGLWEKSIFIVYGDHPPHFSKENFAPIKNAAGVSLKNIRENRVPLFVLMPGHEGLIETHGQDYSDVIGGLCDVFPTIMHLIGETIPYGLYGTHLFVANRDRDPMPVHGGYTYNEILYSGKDGMTIQENGSTLYTDNQEAIVTNKGLQRRLYSQTTGVLNLHMQFFMNNAQEILVKYNAQQKSNSEIKHIAGGMQLEIIK